MVDGSAPTEPKSPRAQRLQEVEHRPPEWLVDDIGRPPNAAKPATEQLAWRRAALALDDLGHTFGTRIAASGEVSLRTLQEWMGHGDAKTTLIYADYQPSEHEAAIVGRAFRR